MQTDRDKQFADLTQFGYYTNEKLNWNRKNDFCILHSIICSLQSNDNEKKILIENLDFQFDVLAVTETWHTKDNIHFNPGIMERYQKYEGNPGFSMNEWCGFFINDTLAYNEWPDLHIKAKTQKQRKWIWNYMDWN